MEIESELSIPPMVRFLSPDDFDIKLSIPEIDRFLSLSSADVRASGSIALPSGDFFASSRLGDFRRMESKFPISPLGFVRCRVVFRRKPSPGEFRLCMRKEEKLIRRPEGVGSDPGQGGSDGSGLWERKCWKLGEEVLSLWRG